MSTNAFSKSIKDQICKITYKNQDEWAAEMAAICLCTGYTCDREINQAKVWCTSSEVAQQCLQVGESESAIETVSIRPGLADV